MGELVEISMVGKNLNLYKQLLDFLIKYTNEEYIIKSIKVMDNWKYDNIFELSSLSEINKYIIEKIICIDIKTVKNKNIGESIESKKDMFYIEGWFNFSEEITRHKYENLINNFVVNFKNNESINVCGIGKEIMVNYDSGILQAIEESHNIDLWMISGDYSNYKFKNTDQNFIFLNN